MPIPPHSPHPTPRPPRDRDAFIVVLAGLGFLGGATGWLIINSMSMSPLVSAPLAGTPTAPALPGPDPMAAGNELPTDSRSPTVPTAPARSSTNTIELVPAVPIPGSPVPDGSNLPSPQLRGQAPSPSAAVTVPEPQVPNSEGVEELPIIRTPLTFTDIPAGYWAKPYIDALTARGIMTGLPDGSFAPNRPMTRAELAVKVANGFAIAPQKTPKTFTDVPADYWATAKIQEAVQTGFMTGYPAGDFRPTETVPRLQVLLALAAGLSLPAPNEAEKLLAQYQDAQKIPPWARGSVAAVIEAGIISASPATNYELRPTDPATRAEVAVIIYRALAYMGKVEPLP